MKGVASHSSDICHIVHRLLLSGKWKWNGSPNLWAWEKRWKNSDIQQEDLCFACFNSNLTGAVNLDICLWLILLMSWCVLCFTLSPIHHYQFLNIMNVEMTNQQLLLLFWNSFSRTYYSERICTNHIKSCRWAWLYYKLRPFMVNTFNNFINAVITKISFLVKFLFLFSQENQLWYPEMTYCVWRLYNCLWRTVKDMRARSHFQPFLATFQVYVSANTVHSVTLNTVLSEF